MVVTKAANALQRPAITTSWLPFRRPVHPPQYCYGGRAAGSLRVAVFGPALAEDPVEDVAEQPALRRNPARPQPTTPRLLGVATATTKGLTVQRTKTPKMKIPVHRTSELGSLAAFHPHPL